MQQGENPHSPTRMSEHPATEKTNDTTLKKQAFRLQQSGNLTTKYPGRDSRVSSMDAVELIRRVSNSKGKLNLPEKLTDGDWQIGNCVALRRIAEDDLLPVTGPDQ